MHSFRNCFFRSLHSTIKGKERMISALVINQPGSLEQISSAFAHDNISTLSVVPTLVPELQRVTIVCFLKDNALLYLKQRLTRLVAVSFFNIITINDKNEDDQNEKIDKNEDGNIEDDMVQRTQLLVKVQVNNNTEQKALERLMLKYDGKIVHEKKAFFEKEEKEVMVHLVQELYKIDFILENLKKYFKMNEVQRSSPVFVDRVRPTLLKEQKESFTPHVYTQVVPALPIAKSSTKCNIYPKVQHDPIITTQMQYTNKQGHYNETRLRLHARIAAQLYGLHITTNRPVVYEYVHPTFILLIGIPGAGKNTLLCCDWVSKYIDVTKFVNFDVDECLALLPEFYHAMLNISLGNNTNSHQENVPDANRRYAICQEEAQFIVRKNVQQGIMDRKNIVLHGSGKSVDTYAHILQTATSSGYTAHVVCVDLPLHVAHERVLTRSQGGYGRMVPMDVVNAASFKIVKTFRRLVHYVNYAHLFDSEIYPPKLIWSKQKGDVVKSTPLHDLQQKYEPLR